MTRLEHRALAIRLRLPAIGDDLVAESVSEDQAWVRRAANLKRDAAEMETDVDHAELGRILDAHMDKYICQGPSWDKALAEAAQELREADEDGEDEAEVREELEKAA